MQLAQALAKALDVPTPRRFETPITVHLAKGEKVIVSKDKKVKRNLVESCEICGEKGDLHNRGDMTVCGCCL